MGKDFCISSDNIFVNVSYSNVSNTYNIGLSIGKVYTILRNQFKSEEEATDFLYENFDYVERC